MQPFRGIEHRRALQFPMERAPEELGWKGQDVKAE
jgi:hypothetical protein